MPTGRALAGRDEELAVLRRARRDGRSVVLTGSPGLGATALVAAAMDGPGRHGLWLAGSPGGHGVPLAPLRALLGAVTPNDVLARLHDALADRPTLVVDDARHLDDATAAVLHQVVQADLAPTIVVACGAALPVAVGRLLRDPRVERVSLRPLTDASLADLARGWVGGPVDGRSLHRLLALAAGRPAVLHELVEGGRAAGTLVHDGLIHRLDGPPTPSAALDAQVAETIGRLTDGQRRALEVAVVSTGLDLDVAIQLVEGGAVDGAAVEALERLGLLVAAGDELVVTDPLLSEVVRRRVGSIARRRVNRELALAAEHAGAGRTPAARRRRVTWAHRGGLGPDPTALLAAGRDAAAAGEVDLGDELAWAAFTARPGVEAALIAAWCRSRRGTVEALLEAHAAAVSLATDPWDRALSAQQEASARWWAHEDLVAARELLAPADLPDGPWWHLLAAQGAMFDFLEGSIAHGLVAVATVGRADDGHAGFTLALAHGLALALADRGAEAVVVAERARAQSLGAAEELYGNPEFHALAVVMGLMYEGRLDEAAGVAELLYAEAVRRVEPNAVGWAAIFSGSIAFLRGDLGPARALLAESESAFLEARLPGVARWAITVQVLAAFAADDVAAAEAARERLAALRPDGFGLFVPLEHLGDAWAAFRAGRLDTARSLAVAAAREAADAGAWSHVSHIVHDLGRFGWWDEAVTVLEEVPAPGSALTRARARFLRAGAADDGTGLDAASDLFSTLGALLFAAEASACAAAAHRRAGDRRKATAAGARMAALLGAVAQAATPPLRLGAGSDLTAREHDVVTLAIAGQSNRAIAGELGIAERTVENHLHRAFAKLGVASRSELRAALDARDALRRG